MPTPSQPTQCQHQQQQYDESIKVAFATIFISIMVIAMDTQFKIQVAKLLALNYGRKLYQL